MRPLFSLVCTPRQTPAHLQYLPVKTAKDLTRESWESTDDKEMSQYLGWVMRSLRTRGQRVSTVFWERKQLD